VLDAFDPSRVLADLRELTRRTGGPGGAQRVAWTAGWRAARAWLREQLERAGAPVQQDEAGNLWAGDLRSDGVVVVGSHVDSVPAGGWLDGVLGACAALEALRAAGPDAGLRLVDWADEEGARFGLSLFGSSCAAGTLDVQAARRLRDADGTSLADALAAHGLDLERVLQARERLRGVAAVLELHIEQGPVLEAAGESAGAVVGCFGVERHRVVLAGAASHAGSTPMDRRRDAFLAAARLALAARELALAHGGVATTGVVRPAPGVPTIIPGACELTLDQRALEADVLAARLAGVREAAERIAGEEGVAISWEPLFRIAPTPFHPELVELAAEACAQELGSARRLPSGALHDAAATARAGIPTVMVFAPSTGGVSHSAAEDTPEADLRRALRVYARLVERVLARR
jgi:N-carbamoyl-L-amino-acid hydrolase